MAFPNKPSKNPPKPSNKSSTKPPIREDTPNPITPESSSPTTAPTGPAITIPAPARYGDNAPVNASPPIKVIAKSDDEPATIAAAS